MDTLVVDQFGFAVQTMKWEDVMTLYSKDRIRVLDSDPHKILRSQSLNLEMPIVVQLKSDFTRRARRDLSFSKKNVARRDDYRCQYCGKDLTHGGKTFDHVIPKSRGGGSSWKNMVLCCSPCNTRKADKTPEEAGMKLLRRPEKPSPSDGRFRFRLKIRRPKPQWKKWLEV